MRFLHRRQWARSFILLALPCLAGGIRAEEVAPARGMPLRLSVTFPAGVREDPVSGRVLLFLSKSGGGEPRRKMNWFTPEPVFAIDVKDLRPGEPVVFTPDGFRDPAALAFPEPLGRLEPGRYHAQVVIDQDRTRRDYNEGPGNLFSRVVPVDLNGARGGAYDLVAGQRVEEPVYADTEWVKFVRIHSGKLSRFHRRDVFLQAAVLLPFGYEEEPERRYPVSYIVPGFGGRHDGLLRAMSGRDPRAADWKRGTVPFRGFEVMLDPDVPTGHSVFANSANNGPVGDALVEELIPALESRFRMIAEARGRFVRGHSSGGWSALWLQVAYPDFFGGCWSSAPDPVDFRAFQTMNIYEDPNGHWTREGFPRPVARTRTGPRLNFIQFNHLEYVLGEGGQLDSFNAVFSPRGADGEPRPVMDKLSGAIDREVARHWRQYDIRLLLQERWPELGPKLQGKLRVTGGAWDTFYLEPALDHLKAFLDPLDHGGYVEILPGDHGSFMTRELRERIDREMAEQFSNGR
jgi:hypothetical protein